ncbi:MAG: DUF5678 domain-containing protein [Fimbriimonadales bacterium]
MSEDAVSNLRLQHLRGLIELEERRLNEEEDLREVEMVWIQEHRPELARQYPGEWIAIVGQQLVAHAADLASLLNLARQSGHPDPFVTAMPREPVRSLKV